MNSKISLTLAVAGLTGLTACVETQPSNQRTGAIAGALIGGALGAQRDEDRLATATHVVDNGGDRDSLIEQVDALWVTLNELSPDTSPEE